MRCTQVGKYMYSTRPIGKGAFSTVYKGLNIDNDELVAVKVIDKLNLKATLSKRIYSEINLLTKLSHPHIIILKDFLKDQDSLYLILEYCSGGDLSHLIKQSQIPENNAKLYMGQLISALCYLRDLNLVHRDLKPHNILLSGDLQTIKLTDFNFARELHDDDLAQTTCGSPLYMAPEIIERNDYSPKTELWSLGIILYEMVYSTTPYSDSQGVIDLLEKIKSRPVVYTDRATDPCNDLIQKMLQFDPAQRMTWDDLTMHPWLECKELFTTPKLNMIRDNYEPPRSARPGWTQTVPVGVYPHRGRASKTMVDSFWSYINNSVAVIKGAVDYIASD